MAGTTRSSGPSNIPGMGAVLQGQDCTFRAWAPFADAVYVAGSFAARPWDDRIDLSRDNPSPGPGHWSALVYGVPDHTEY